MKLSRTQNAKKNVLAAALNKISTLLLPFVLRTIIIQVLGADYLGLNSLFSSILQVLNLSELGVGAAITFSMYKAIADDDKPMICALMNFYRKIYQRIGMFFLIVGLMLLPFIGRFISGSYPNDINIYVIYLVFLMNSAISYFFFAYKAALLTAHQKSNVISNVHTVVFGVSTVLQIVFILFVKHYYAYLVLLVIGTLLNNLIAAYLANRYYPEYQCKGCLSSESLKKIKVQIGGLLITKVCYISRNAFDSIFVSMFLGLTVSAMYGNYYMILIAVSGMIAIINSSIVAGVGNCVATESIEKNYNDLKKFNYIYMLIYGWATVCLVCLYQPFMCLWMGDEYMFAFDIVILLSLYFYSLGIGNIRSVYSDAVGLWWENRYRAIIEAVVNILLNYFLGKYFGVAGIIVATLISLLIINFGFGSQIIFKYYFKNNKLGEYFKLHFQYAFVTLLVILSTYFVCEQVSFEGYLALVCKLMLCGVIPFVLYMVAYCKDDIAKDSIRWLFKKVIKN